MESLECSNALAKQVLSQLSYTPINHCFIHFLSLGSSLQPLLTAPVSSTSFWGRCELPISGPKTTGRNEEKARDLGILNAVALNAPTAASVLYNPKKARNCCLPHSFR
jgi:hypothetical protein